MPKKNTRKKHTEDSKSASNKLQETERRANGELEKSSFSTALEKKPSQPSSDTQVAGRNRLPSSSGRKRHPRTDTSSWTRVRKRRS